jgi:hypothetical protein
MENSLARMQTRQPRKPEASLTICDSFAVRISKRLGLRIYSDTKPNNLKIANLQKGLVFVYDGVERLAEGTGLGFPVVMTSSETYFSGTASLQRFRDGDTFVVRKVFTMDRLARNTIRNVRLENSKVRMLFKGLSSIYQKHRQFRYLTLMLKNIPLQMGVRTDFVKASSVGVVTVTYRISRERVLVKAEFRLLEEVITSIFMLNEQGPEFFNKYEDSNGTVLFDGQIGAWDTVNAEWACVTNADNGAGFQVKNEPNSVLRRGRETQKNTLDWIGLDYEIDPKRKLFEYEIKILGA